MLNKILLRKIKFPLSWRGVFSFCHSRESGNPSSLSLRGAKQRSNLKGFSLIELMVAVVILALAVLGIFQAYSVGFMGMADARDRTVATNYLQETLEDYKNMDFKKVKDEPITLIVGTKFHRGSIVLDLEKKDNVVTLKKVITQVRWMDRKGNIKTEEASTILYNKPNTSEVSNAAGIILYAQPYYTILPNTTVILTAEIKDENGNTLTDWVGDITFSIITSPPNDPPVGFIAPDPKIVRTTNGLANIIFTAVNVVEGESVDGIEQIQASATLDVVGEVTDTVNIRVTTGAVAIILTPATTDDEILPTNETSTINVTVVKADYITPIAYDGDITLSATDLGTLSTTTINSVSVPPPQTIVTLTSTGTPGVVEVTASAPDLDMGYTEVTFTGDAKSILISAKKKSIYPDEETTITVTIVDENNKPVSFGTSEFSKTVDLTVSPEGYGTFDISSLKFKGDSSKTCVFKAYAKEVIDGLILPQEITISANDSGGKLTSGSIKINILSSLVAHHIFVSYSPSVVELDIEGEQKFSEINAIMQDEYNNETVYGNSIIFDTDFGTFLSSGTSSTTLTGGIATAYLYPPSDISTTIAATINIYSYNLESNSGGPPGNPENPVKINVLFHKKSAPHHINLTATPQNIFVGGQTCTLTAKVVDESGVTYSDYIGGVSFTITGTTSSVSYDTLNIDASSGVATLDLTSTDNPGTIHITAKTLDLISEYNYDEEVTSSQTTVNINAVDIELVDNSIIYYDNGKIVMFNINIIGPALNLKSMTIEWGYDPSKLSKIEMKSPYTATVYNPIIDTGNAKTPYTKNDINANLLSGESTIRLTFSKSMIGKTLKVTFDTNFGAYEYTETITVVQ